MTAAKVRTHNQPTSCLALFSHWPSVLFLSLASVQQVTCSESNPSLGPHSQDEESTGLDYEHALREASTTTPKSRSATDILLGTVVRETADGKRTRKEEIARLTGLVRVVLDPR